MPDFDILIKDGIIIDGSGKARFKADLGIADGKVAYVGDLSRSSGGKVIVARGLVVSPGFIDCHAHSDWTILVHPTGDSKVMQGVTTELNGLCGFGAAPIDRDEWWKIIYVRMCVGGSVQYAAAAYNYEPLGYGRQLEVDWSTLEEFLDRLEQTRIGINYATLFGHSQIRYYTMGLEARLADEDELKTMKTMAEQAMLEGAFGISAGLSGSPGCWADTQELIDLCMIVKKYDGVYMPHQRHSSLTSSIEESIEIAEKTGIHTCISHTGGTPETRRLIDEARARGVDVTFDMFAHTGSVGGNIVQYLPHFLSRRRDEGLEWIVRQLKDTAVRERFRKEFPKWRIRQVSIPGKPMYTPGPGESLEPDFDKWRVARASTLGNQRYLGMTFEQIAKERGADPWTAWFDMLVEEQGHLRWSWSGGGIHSASLDERLKVPYVSIMTDSLIESPRGVTVTSQDPRAYSTYPLVLEYVRKTNVISLEDAIVRMTSNSAKAIGIKDRGLLRKGFWADIVVFNPETVAPVANYENCFELSQGINHDIYPVGIEYVIVNGVVVTEKGRLTGNRPGHVLRKNVP
jgi:N-acyl-D-aspartate/D-glutamate deacylase